MEGRRRALWGCGMEEMEGMVPLEPRLVLRFVKELGLTKDEDHREVE